MFKRRWGTNPMKENQIEANNSIDKQTRYNQIIEVMGKDKLTFRDIAYRLYKKGYTPTPELLYSQPRVTELVQKGRIEPVGKVISKTTGKSVTVFEVIYES